MSNETTTTVMYTDADALRFLDKVALPKGGVDDIDACWFWTGAKHGQGRGYGKFWLGGKVVSAHRASYMLFVGPIPDGHIVGHECNIESCVNPFHFKAQTQAENMQYCVACGRHSNQGK